MEKTVEEILKSNNIEIGRFKKDNPMLYHNLLKAMEQYGNLRYEEGKPKWISVKERLPENDKMVLIFDDKDNLDFGIYDQRWIAYFNIYRNIKSWEVTHWMPLPESPVKYESLKS